MVRSPQKKKKKSGQSVGANFMKLVNAAGYAPDQAICECSSDGCLLA